MGMTNNGFFIKKKNILAMVPLRPKLLEKSCNGSQSLFKDCYGNNFLTLVATEIFIYMTLVKIT